MRRALLLSLALTAAPLAGPAVGSTAGLAFLRLGASARTAALGEAVTAVTAREAASHNPAALAGEASLSLTHGEWIEDIRHDYLTATWQWGASRLGASTADSKRPDYQGASTVSLRDRGATACSSETSRRSAVRIRKQLGSVGRKRLLWARLVEFGWRSAISAWPTGDWLGFGDVWRQGILAYGVDAHLT